MPCSCWRRVLSINDAYAFWQSLAFSRPAHDKNLNSPLFFSGSGTQSETEKKRRKKSLCRINNWLWVQEIYRIKNTFNLMRRNAKQYNFIASFNSFFFLQLFLLLLRYYYIILSARCCSRFNIAAAAVAVAFSSFVRSKTKNERTEKS